MYKQDVSKHYKENAVYTMSPEELTLMLYNGLIKFLMKAEEALEHKKYEESHRNIVRAQDIIGSFMESLNMDYEVSGGMMALYQYMLRRLVVANIKKDKKVLEEVLGYAREFRDTWQQAMKIVKTDQSYQKIKAAR